jgi:hypothetical protein
MCKKQNSHDREKLDEARVYYGLSSRQQPTIKIWICKEQKEQIRD